MERRTFLKTVGGIGAGAAVIGYGISQSVTAASASIQSDDVSVTNDRGDITEVTINPDFDVSWQNFDDVVGKVFWLVEARVAGGDWWPLYRATPWLSPREMGTTGTLKLDDFASRLGRPIVVADRQGRPDYSSFDFSSLGGVDYSSYMDGTSMSGADEYTQSGSVGLNGEVLQNNFPSANAGYYGAAETTGAGNNPAEVQPFDEPGDGESSGTDVELRYTIELQRPNVSQLEYILDNAPYRKYDPGSGASIEELADAITKAMPGDKELFPADIDDGNSRIVMEGEDGYPSFNGYSDGAGIPYSVLRDNSDEHPGIIQINSSFTVTANNELSETSTGNESSGSDESGTNAS